MFNSRTLLILLLPLLLGSNCCKKDKETYYMDQEFKDYIVFNPGSYWVYRDTIDTAKNDSVNLSSQEIIIAEGSKLDFNYEILSQWLFSTYYLESFNPIEGKIDFNNLNSYIYQMGGGGIFFSQEKVGTIKESFVEYETYLDSIFVNNIIYYKIKIFKILPNDINNFPNKIYWAKNIGIIKKEMYDGTVWELIRHNGSQ